MNIELQLEKAFSIALAAHEGQVDQQGQPYLLHLIRVMLNVPDGPARVVALLHDLLEDTDWTAGDLRENGFDEEVVAAVVALTRRDGEAYAEFIDRVQANPLAKTVKIADVEDNLGRIAGLAQIDPQKAQSLEKRYKKAYRQLTGTA